jgi:MscS family membrane protein
MRFFHTARAACILALVGGSGFAAPQTPPAETHDPLNRDTPQSSVFSFLEACRAKDYSRAWRYLDLRDLPRDQRLSNGTQLAKQLSQVLDRDATFDIGSLSHEPDGDEKDELPPDRERIDTFVVDGRSESLLLERITLQSGLKVWLFSPDSVRLVPKLVLLTGGSVIEKHLPPPLVNWTLMDTALWRWIALLLLALLLAAVSRWLSRLAVFLVDKALARLSPGVSAGTLKSLIAPLQLLFPVVVFRAALASIGPSPLLRLALERALTGLLFLGFAWLSARIVDVFIGRLRGVLNARHNATYLSVLPLASRVVKLVIFLLIVAAILSNWGYNTSTILAGLGVGGLAIALAAQKTVENLFGGVAVISDRPVAIGDYCKFGDREGTVEDIGLRSTRVRTTDRTLVTVPNGLFSAMTIENFARQDKMLFHIKLNLRRDTTPDQVRALLRSIGATLTGNPRIEAGATPVRFVGLGSYSLDLEIFVYILTRNGDEFLRIQQELLLTVLDEIAAAGTALALPTQASVSDSLTALSNQPNPAPVSNSAH